MISVVLAVLFSVSLYGNYYLYAELKKLQGFLAQAATPSGAATAATGVTTTTTKVA